MADEKQTVYLVDDDNDVRHALVSYLCGSGYHVIDVESANSLLDSLGGDTCGVLILDLCIDGINGIELQEKLAEHDVVMPVIFISGYGSVELAVMAMKAGAVDFIEKPFSNETLLASIQEAFCKLEFEQHQRSCRNAIQRLYQTLTQREKEVMDHVILGVSNKALADKLQVSHRTVEVHRSNIMKKMQADSLPDLVRMADICGGAG